MALSVKFALLGMMIVLGDLVTMGVFPPNFVLRQWMLIEVSVAKVLLGLGIVLFAYGLYLATIKSQ